MRKFALFSMVAAVVLLAAPVTSRAAEELLSSSDFEADQIRKTAEGIQNELKKSTNALDRANRRSRDLPPASRPGEEDVDEISTGTGEADARIVNGVLTARYPSVGAVLKTQEGKLGAWCTGTLIGCRTVLTAHHCVEDDPTPGPYRVFFHHAGIFKVTKVDRFQPYDFPDGDLAILTLDKDVTGVRPTAIYTGGPIADGTYGRIVGFGRTGGTAYDYGLKRVGTVSTASCEDDLRLVCWNYDAPVGLPGENSNTCNADSGGPLLIVSGSARVLAGVTSGGTRSSCLAGDHAYDVDVRQFADWIRGVAGTDLDGSACSTLPRIGAPKSRYFSKSVRLSAGQGQDFKVTVPAGVSVLRVTSNGEDLTDEDDTPTTNLDLFVKRGSAATGTDADCKRNDNSQVGECEIVDPVAGEYFIRVQQSGSAAGTAQLVVSMFMKP